MMSGLGISTEFKRVGPQDRHRMLEIKMPSRPVRHVTRINPSAELGKFPWAKGSPRLSSRSPCLRHTNHKPGVFDFASGTFASPPPHIPSWSGETKCPNLPLRRVASVHREKPQCWSLAFRLAGKRTALSRPPWDTIERLVRPRAHSTYPSNPQRPPETQSGDTTPGRWIPC